MKISNILNHLDNSILRVVTRELEIEYSETQVRAPLGLLLDPRGALKNIYFIVFFLGVGAHVSGRGSQKQN